MNHTRPNEHDLELRLASCARMLIARGKLLELYVHSLIT